MTESIYLDTSIAGYLTARTCNDLIIMANMEITREWWENRRGNFNIYISEVVLDEAALGDAEIAAIRLNILSNFPLLEVNDTVESLAAQLLSKSNLPPKAANDALHIAIATVYKLDYLLTWNCKHMANAQIQKKLSKISIESGYTLPTICTPHELMGD